MAAAHRVSCLHLTLDSDSRPAVHSCAVMAILLVETVISDVGHANARNGLCRPVSEPPAAFRRVDSLSLLGRESPIEKTAILLWVGKGAAYAAEKGRGQSSPDVLISI